MNDTHIWGDQADDSGVDYVAGLRLVRAREQARSAVPASIR